MQVLQLLRRRWQKQRKAPSKSGGDAEGGSADDESTEEKPGAKSTTLVVDMGAGSCRLAKELSGQACVVSVDFAPPSKTFGLPPVRSSPEELLAEGGLHIGSMTSVPLPDHCADAVVYCLSLMGTDWPEFLAEGHRLVKRDTGVILIAEVASRISQFTRLCRKLKKAGLEVDHHRLFDDGYFTLMTLKPVSSEFHAEELESSLLTPCCTKKRRSSGSNRC